MKCSTSIPFHCPPSAIKADSRSSICIWFEICYAGYGVDAVCDVYLLSTEWCFAFRNASKTDYSARLAGGLLNSGGSIQCRTTEIDDCNACECAGVRII